MQILHNIKKISKKIIISNTANKSKETTKKIKKILNK